MSTTASVKDALITKGSPPAKSPASAASRREGAVPVSMIFKGCDVFINPALDLAKMEQYRKMVREHGGGVQYYFEVSKTTHVITADLAHFADLQAAREADIQLVTPLWLVNSVRFGEREEEQFYSPDPKKFFSGLCICSSQIPVKDRDAMFAGVVAYGGRVSARLNHKCTHLIISTPASGAKYEWARKHGGIKIVTIKWYNNSLLFRRRESEAEHAVPDESAGKKAPTSVLRREQVKKEAEADQQKEEQAAKKGGDRMEQDDEHKEEKEKEKSDDKKGGDEDDMDLMSQFEVNQSSEWPMEGGEGEGEDKDKDGEGSADKKEEFNLMLGQQRNKRAREDDEGEEKEEAGKREAKTRKTTEKGDGDDAERAASEGEEEEELAGEGEAEGEEWREEAEGDAATDAKPVSRAAQLEDEIKSYIRKNVGTYDAAHRVSARELRLKFKMGHPRAKRILNEVIQEMKREIKKHAKKRQSVDGGDDDKSDPKEKEAAPKKKTATTATATATATTPSKDGKAATPAVVAAKEEGGPKVPKNQLMKGMCVLLIDLSASRYRDAMEAVREMGGTTHRGMPDACKIEGVQWKKAAETNITHVLYPHPTPAIEALKKKMALHGLADAQDVSIEWVQWCDVHVRLFPPRISPLFQPLPPEPVPGMEELIVSQSNTRGWEREEIMGLISKLGAKYNRSMPNEPNVILIIATADGAAKSEKVVMAKEWGVPVVTKEWLYDCARKWRRIDPVAEGYVVSLGDLEGGGKEGASKAEPANAGKDKKKGKSEAGDKEKAGKGDIKERRAGGGDEQEENDEHDELGGAKKAQPPRTREISTTKRCTQCGATKTPCWRKGADGVRSLCNACGLKFSAELRRKTSKHDTRKRKRDGGGGAFDDLDDDDDDIDARLNKRRSLAASGGGGSAAKKRRRSGADGMDEGDALIDDDEEDGSIGGGGGGDDDNLDAVQRRVRRMMASQDSKGRYHFAFSCLSKQVTAQLKRVVTKLGGTYSDMWESGVTTHLILGTLRRTEKMLCACASGSWVLQPTYLTKSDKKGRFLREEEFEWYDEDWDDEQEKRIWAGCMRRHRLNLLETGKRSFEGWEFHLVGDTEPMPDIMAKIIEAGGGKLISTRSLVKLKKHKEHRYGLIGANADKRAVRRLTEVGIPCVDSIYLPTFLCDRHAPAVDDFFI